MLSVLERVQTFIGDALNDQQTMSYEAVKALHADVGRLIEMQGGKAATKSFWVFWVSGGVDEITGDNIEQAFREAGYGGGIVAAIDFYENVPYGLDIAKRIAWPDHEKDRQFVVKHHIAQLEQVVENNLITVENRAEFFEGVQSNLSNLCKLYPEGKAQADYTVAIMGARSKTVKAVCNA